MQIQQNINQPNFRSFKFSPEALEYIIKRIPNNKVGEFEKIINTEKASRPNIEILVDLLSDEYLTATISGSHLESPTTTSQQIIRAQGLFSRMFKGPLGFLSYLSEQSKKMSVYLDKKVEMQRLNKQYASDDSDNAAKKKLIESIKNFLDGDISLEKLLSIKSVIEKGK